jgi:hypothetical protein
MVVGVLLIVMACVSVIFLPLCRIGPKEKVIYDFDYSVLDLQMLICQIKNYMY